MSLQRIGISLAIMGKLICSVALAAIQIVTLSTDKSSYHPNEEVTLELRNELGRSIYCHAVSASPAFFVDRLEKKEGEEWRPVPVRCSWPECHLDIDGPGKMDSGQRVFIKILLTRHDKQMKTDLPLEPGVYRWIGNYQERPEGTDSKQWRWLEVLSNQFVIRK